ncbi:MAG: carotenoid 1,2-hydratase [Gammaproteobacteria bacterium]|nr:carotenoid 1,2-hydratase [Gammaproteobacteria bacterium]
MKWPLIASIIFSSSIFAADNFEILRNSGEGFARVLPGKTLEFPADHAPHPEYRIEWWYITANLGDSQGRQWGLQWTLFRQALAAKAEQQSWSNNQLWMAHAAISTPHGHHFEQRFSRGGIGQAGVIVDDNFEAWIDDWKWQSGNDSLFPSALDFRIADREIHMQLKSNDSWILHGDAGYSQKSQQGQASYYYSQPKIQISGTIGETQLTGTAWLDREWSSQPLAPDQQGWDWFSLHLDDGNKLMLYRLRHDDGEHWLSASWIDLDGRFSHLSNDEVDLSELNLRPIKTSVSKKIRLPLDWLIKLPELDRELHVRPLYDQQWMGTSFPYWEGVVLVEDEQGAPIGRGYMELMGYQ